MKHLKTHPITENFKVREFVMYDGERARVLNRDGSTYAVWVMRNREEVTDVDVSELSAIPRCLGKCDKRPIRNGGEQEMYCFGCKRSIFKM
jgi:hypothetical protein